MFYNDEKELISNIKSDLCFYHWPQTLMEPEDYYLFAFLVAKNLVVFILYVWTMAVIIEYQKYLNDLKRNPLFILDESEAAGLEATEIHVNAQNFPELYMQIKNVQYLLYNGQVHRVIFDEN
uniref:Uncharacterized protein n=1 Tax=Panagrolaimus sp. ES5 TaxID=591445 RepID=A0AC34FP80_9BILA